MEELKPRDHEVFFGKFPGMIEEILVGKEFIDEILNGQYKKKLAILFANIYDYPNFIDTRSDVCGKSLVQKLRQIVMPIIAGNKGTIYKTLGDELMAYFPDPLSAVKASIAIQKRLYAYNTIIGEISKIHVRIGISWDEVYMKESDIYGNAVSQASRIQSHAKAYQIIISKKVYEKVKSSEDITCMYDKYSLPRGRAQSLKLFQVIWGKPKLRASEEPDEERMKKSIMVFRLEVLCERDHLKISSNEHMAGEESTIRHYEQIPISMEWINKECNEMVDTFNKALRLGIFKRELLLKLRETGQAFYEKLFSPSLKKKLDETRAHYLTLHIDDQLVQIPWELIFDGHQFLCQRFNMGRLVKTKQTVNGSKSRVLSKPLNMLIIADLEGDLKNAYAEGSRIRDFMLREKNFINITLRSKNLTCEYLKKKFEQFDIVHFAGHAEFNHTSPEESGWKTGGKNITARDISTIATSKMPALIFSNACQSARTNEWTLKEQFQEEIFGLANAFLLAGVKHYIGTFWEIPDNQGSYFALEFYENILSGMSIGEALRKARLSLINQYEEEAIIWASYVLYGDPTSNYMEQIKEPEPDEKKYCMVRSETAHRDLNIKESNKKTWSWKQVLTGASLSLIIMLLITNAYMGLKKSYKDPHGNLPNIFPSYIQEAGIDPDFQKITQTIQILSSYQDQLTQQFNNKGFFATKSQSDTWTSQPISICIIAPNWQELDDPAVVSLKGHYEKLFNRMIEVFTQTTSIGLSVLERKRIAGILQELQIGIPTLSSKSLQDAYTLLSARIILFPEPVSYKTREGLQSEISLRLVETHSTEILTAFSQPFFPETESLETIASELVRKTIENLATHYPLKGRIMSLEGDEIKINLGHNMGVRQDQVFTVLNTPELDTPEERTTKGYILIKKVNESTAVAEILEQNVPFESGDPIKGTEKKL